MKRKISKKNNKKDKKIKLDDLQIDKSLIFADPTYDVTFKMLFGNDKNKDILISLLNSLLGFKDDKEIIDVEINSNELPVSVFSMTKELSGVTSSVDVLCTNKGKQKIAIEMQGQKTKYFLAREQEYMAKLISNQVKEGEGKKYHEKVLETYIIIIGKSNIFIGNTKLKDQELFEIDVVPMVVQTNEIIPSNKMNWKFFELPKFVKSSNYKSISKTSPLKEQWLEFLIDCSKQQEKPDRDKIIKKGYEIMKVAKWDEDTQTLYWKQKANEKDLLETLEIEKQEEFDRGKLKGEIKGEIKNVKNLINFKVKEQDILKTLKFLLKEGEKKALENIAYIQDHIDDGDSDIGESLGLLGDI